MTDSELVEFIRENRRNRTTVAATKVKEVKAKAEKKSIISISSGLSPEEKAILIAALKGKL